MSDSALSPAGRGSKMEPVMDSQRLILLVGFIGSGKTTYARELWKAAPYRLVRVSMDDLIQMLSFYDYQRHLVDLYRRQERATVIHALARGLDVVVDRTNLDRKTRRVFLEIGRTFRRLAARALELLRSEGLFGRPHPREIQRALLHLIQPLEDREAFATALTEAIETLARGGGASLFPWSPEPPTLETYFERLRTLRLEAVWLRVPPEICLERRLSDPLLPYREQVRTVDWQAVLEKMQGQLEPPSLREGFDEIRILDADLRLQEILTPRTHG